MVTAVITNKTEEEDDSGPIQELIFGISMIVLSVIIQAVQFIVEEKLLGNLYISSKRLTGWEGIWGLIFFGIFLSIAQFIKCEGNLCTNGKLEDTVQAVDQLLNHPFLLTSIILVAFFGCMLNVLGILITKHTTSAHRATINQVKVVSIWVFFLLYTGYGTQEDFLWLQLVGFLVLVTGVCIFNEIIVLPFLGFNKNTKKAIMNREYRKSLKLLWDINLTDETQTSSVKQTIGEQVEREHAFDRITDTKSRTTIFGASDF